MLGSLYGDLPQAKNSAQEEAAKVTKQNSWIPSSLAPLSRKPSVLSAPPSVLRAGRGKPTSATQRQQAIKRENSDPATCSVSAGALAAYLCYTMDSSRIQHSSIASLSSSSNDVPDTGMQLRASSH